MAARSALVLGLLLALTAACSGGSHHASPSTSAPPTPSSHATPPISRPLSQPVTIRGTMFMSGGLTNREIPVNGTVVATDATSHEVDVAVHSGAFSMQLAPGTYKFVGRTPQWNRGDPCPSVGPITFVEPQPQYRGPGASVSIVCPMK
jgi:hypothetical protein